MWMNNNIKLDLVENRCKSVEWIHLAQDRIHRLVIVNKVMTTGIPKKASYFLSS